MDLFKRIRGTADKTPAGSPESVPLSAPPSIPAQLAARSDTRAVELDSRTGTRRELLRMLTRDTLRFSGVPEDWIESQVLLEPGANGRTLMHLRLVLKHWNAEFMGYLVAFQRRLVGEVERYEPDAREWIASVTWQLAMEDQCPLRDMPVGAWWGEVAPTQQLTEEEMAVNEAEQDLAKLLAIRDAHLQDSRHPSGSGERG
jgi:hypothetical protein